jgi:hypothetical protein
MRRLQQGKSKAEANKLSVALNYKLTFMQETHYNQKMNNILEDGESW